TALAVIDVTTALGELAIACRHTRPQLDDSAAFQVERGRHPVVEAALAGDHAHPFVPNDCDLSPGGIGRLWLVTGPNMAGEKDLPLHKGRLALLAPRGKFCAA